MVRRPPLSTRPDSLFPYPALFLSPGFQLAPGGGPVGVDELFTEARVEGVVAREPFAGAGVAPEVDDVSGSGGHGGSGSGGSPESNVVASSPSCEAGEGWVEGGVG